MQGARLYSDDNFTHPKCDFPTLKGRLNIPAGMVSRNFKALGIIGEEKGKPRGSTDLWIPTRRIPTRMVGYTVYKYFIVMAL